MPTPTPRTWIFNLPEPSSNPVRDPRSPGGRVGTQTHCGLCVNVTRVLRLDAPPSQADPERGGTHFLRRVLWGTFAEGRRAQSPYCEWRSFDPATGDARDAADGFPLCTVAFQPFLEYDPTDGFWGGEPDGWVLRAGGSIYVPVPPPGDPLAYDPETEFGNPSPYRCLSRNHVGFAFAVLPSPGGSDYHLDVRTGLVLEPYYR